jgi:hypothetical protein
MAIQNRRGSYSDFDKSKLVSGEWAVVTSGDPASNSGRSVYMCFEPGQVKRMATYEDMTNDVSAAVADKQKTLQSMVDSATASKTAAANSASQAKSYADSMTSSVNSASASAKAAAQSASEAKTTAASITPMTGATASAAGKGGTVPAPAAGKQDSALKGDGTYSTEIGGLDLQLSDTFINTWKSILGG